jgi:putative ABC transport system substrate-binding protein
LRRNEDELAALAAELVALKVDVIMTNGTPATRLQSRTTQTISHRLLLAADPVKNGLVANLARPEGNVTGFFYGLYARSCFEVLKAALPGVSRVAYPAEPASDAILHAARLLKVQLQTIAVETPQDFERFFAMAVRGRADGVVVPRHSAVYVS